MLSTCSGSCFIAVMVSVIASVVWVPRVCARNRENREKAISWDVYALVEATAISGPAQVTITLSASRATELPTTLVMARTWAPLRLASRRAARVSAVSPDWLTTITRVSLVMMGLR
ncbi:hypothetical protein D3C75_929380 [compost metagenome]